MNYISNVFNYIYSIFRPTNDILDEYIITEQPLDLIDDNDNNVTYIFINTANIYNATKNMLRKLKTDDYKYIKIYLLKSHTLEPLFKKPIKTTSYNLKLIKHKLSTKRRHLHTLTEAIDSFIELNNIKNYNIYY